MKKTMLNKLHKEKPRSMSVKEWLIKTIAAKREITPMVVNAVVSHQFDSARSAMNFNNSIEISGFCKFYFNEKRAIKEMAVLLGKRDYYNNILADELTSEKTRAKTLRILETVESNITLLKTKV